MPNQHSLVPIILCTLASCTWISDARLTEKSQILDRDNDGIPFKEDCNDEDETIYPGATEIFYDGIDQNCDRANDFDQDGDGRVPTEFVDSTTTTGNEELPNLLPGGDCWDLPDPPTGVEGSATVQSVDINSGAADDPPYDGIDQNCDGKDDFDVDGDGYVGDEYAGIETIIGHDTDGNPLTTGGDLPSGDCNDLNNAINIGQTESWYNGIDENCDGLDDYDADFDGYVSNDYAEFSELPSGDCDDTDDTIHPDAIESYYDGVDQNCDGLDDYDADLDGFTPSQYASLSTLPSEDCDDADPEIYPEAIEILNDERDLDCDGTADSMALFDIEWTNFDVLSTTPIRVEQLTASANDDTVYVAFLEDVSSTSNGGANPLAIGFNFTTREIDTYFNWATIPSQYTDGISITVRDTDFFGAFGEYNSQDRWLHLTARNLDSGTITHRRSFVNSSQPSFEDVDLYLDSNDNLHAMGCESSEDSISFQYAMNPSDNFFPNLSNNNTVTATILLQSSNSDIKVSRCKFFALTEPSARMIALSDNAIDLYNFVLPQSTTAPEFSFVQRLNLEDVQEVLMLQQNTSMNILYSTSTGLYLYLNGVDYMIKEGIAPSSARAHQFSNEVFAVAYVDENNDSGLSYINTTTLDQTDYHFSTTFTPTEVQPWILPDGNSIFLLSIGSENLAARWAYIDTP